MIVVSDTHGSIEEVEKHIKKYHMDGNILIHLGDYVEDGEILGNNLNMDTKIVAGNGDYGSKYPMDDVLEIKNHRILLTHGHMYNIRYSYDNLLYKAMEKDVEAVLFGHNHIPVKIVEEDILIFSPGSPIYPRDLAQTKSYGIIEINEEKIEAKLEYI